MLYESDPMTGLKKLQNAINKGFKKEMHSTQEDDVFLTVDEHRTTYAI